MPLNKEAYIRYTIIDRCLGNKQRPFPSMEELMKECEARLGKQFSLSTIQKDIKTMKEDEELGFLAPILFSKSHNGYYYSDPDYTIRSISLQESEIEALKAATDMLSVYSGSRVSKNFGQAVSKIFAAVQERFPEAGEKRKLVQTDYNPNHKGLEYFEFFLHAAKERIPVCFVHYSYKKRQFRSIILHSLFLKEFQNNWYIVGYSENHKSLRTFGLDRIYEPKLLRKKFIDAPEKNVEDYFKHVYGVFPIPGEKLQSITFMASPIISDYLFAHPIHDTQVRTKELESGYGIFRLKLIPSVELINFFLSYSGELFLMTPEWLREQTDQILTNHLSYGKKKNR